VRLWVDGREQKFAANKRQAFLCYGEGDGEWLKSDDLLQKLRRLLQKL